MTFLRWLNSGKNYDGGGTRNRKQQFLFPIGILRPKTDAICFSASDREGSLLSRPGTDYFERNCVPPKSTDIMNAAGSSGGRVTFGSSGGIITADPRMGTGPSLAVEKCTFGNLYYEKTSGHELIRANPYRLLSAREGGIVQDCGRKCENDPRCLGFNMDYNRNECQAVSKNSDNNLFNLRSSTGVSYFEAICLRGNLKWQGIGC